MRTWLIGTLALAGSALCAAPALACPAGRSCISASLTQDRAQRTEVAPTPRDPRTLPSMRHALETYVPEADAEQTEANASGRSMETFTVTMDQVFDALGARVDERLPKFTVSGHLMTMAPVIVQTAFVKIPGVGFSTEL